MKSMRLVPSKLNIEDLLSFCLCNQDDVQRCCDAYSRPRPKLSVMWPHF